MEITIKIDEAKIAELVENMIAKDVFQNYRGLGREAQFGVMNGVDKAVKAYIYSQKDRIIEKCVNRASTELVRKGVPKLIESMKGAEKE